MQSNDSLVLKYLSHVQALLGEAITGQQAAIHHAATLVATSLGRGGLLHVFGTGHSHLLVEEVYGRSGALTPVNAILIPRLMLHEDMIEATLLERREETANEILEEQPLQAGDVMLVISNSGRNGLTIEVAGQAQAEGLSVVALTAVEYSKTLTSRHSSGLRLFEVADVVLDNLGQEGDTCLTIPGTAIRTGATSTVVGAALLNAMMVQAIERLHAAGVTPPVLISANVSGVSDEGSLDTLSRTGRRLSL
jgi:uncharacterized phosphosugar-binding protein